MLRKIVISSAFILFFAVVCLAADLVTGKWVGSITTPNGDNFELTYTLKTEGEKLTGTISTGEGSSAIYDGKVSNENVSFKSTYNDMVVTHEGKVVGDTLKVKLSVDGNVMEGKFLRAKAN